MAQPGTEPTEVAPKEADKLKGEILGRRRVAEAVKRWKGAR